MNRPDHTSLIADLSAEHARRSPKSAALNERAQRPLVDGGSHALRLMEPFPPRIATAHGAWLTDEDGQSAPLDRRRTDFEPRVRALVGLVLSMPQWNFQ